jgi:hypothetical protein
MTRAVSFTKAQIRRAVKAAESAGLRIGKVTFNYRDGSIVIETGGNDVPAMDNRDSSHAASWDDIR